MYKNKPVQVERYLEKDFFNLGDRNDRRIIEAFEKDLQKYQNQEENHFGHRLRGFDLLLLHNGLIKYTKKYYNGAVVESKLPQYRITMAKYQAYGKLLDGREDAKKEEAERNQALISI